MKTWQQIVLIILIFPILLLSQAEFQLDVTTIMQDPKTWVGSFPEKPYWSEDSKWIYFSWNPEAADSDSLYKVAADGGTPTKLSLMERKKIPSQNGVYSRDYQYKLFVRDGDVFIYNRNNSTILQITKTNDYENNIRFSQNEKSVIYRRGNNFYKWDRNTGTTNQIVDIRKGTEPERESVPDDAALNFVKNEEMSLIRILKERKEKNERSVEANKISNHDAIPVIYVGDKIAQNTVLSPDEKYITLRLMTKARKIKVTKVPNYVTESGFTEEFEAYSKVGAPQNNYEIALVDLESDSLMYVKTENLPGIFEPIEYAHELGLEKSAKGKLKKQRKIIPFGPYWSNDGKQAFMVIRSIDNKDRWLATLESSSGKLKNFERQHDEAWVGGPNIYGWNLPGSVGWMPDNKRVWFCSEESGYSHLYVVNPKTGEKKALTKGKYEIYNPRISRDNKYWYFSSNKTHPGERHFYRMSLEGGKWKKLTTQTGRNDVVVSPDGNKLVIRHSFINKPPELYVKNINSSKPVQITQSTKPKWRGYPWRIPKIIQFTASDGAKPYARLYQPEKSNGAAVVFVHGAGYLQNAHKWWSSYFREYMFHNLLVEKGYTVLDIDYRGSAGYGRDWRTAIYRHMGDKDLSDQVDGAKWLVEELNLDANRIGIYGGSYGGFITFMAMFTTPDVFSAGASLRPVTDWAHYHHAYTSNILNIPQADTLAYRRSSPIYFAEGLKGHLLICHGMIDVNVHFQDTVRLVQRLIELGKENWEVAIYPVEGHGFREPSSWTDEYKRILKLFEKNL